MNGPAWKYTDAYKNVVFRVWPNGRTESCADDAPEVLAWVNAGNKILAPDPTPILIPHTVPMWTVRTVLQNDGLFDQTQAIINASSDNALKNVWDYGNFAYRDSAAIAHLASELGLSDAEVDQMFIDANNLTV